VQPDPLAPDDRRTFHELAETIEEELSAQIAVHRLDSEDGERVTAALIADVVWTNFEVRPRAT